MKTSMRLAIITTLTSLLFCANGVAQEYILFNGGVTTEERESAPKEGTKLSFFVRAGNYLSNVSVVVRNQAGQVLVDMVTDGPWLILDLPNGTYQVTATISNGEAQGLAVTVDGSTQEIGFMFRSVQ